MRSNSSDNTIPDSNNVMSTAAVSVDAEVKAPRKNALMSEKKCFTSLNQRSAAFVAANSKGLSLSGDITFLRCVTGTMVTFSRSEKQYHTPLLRRTLLD